MFTDKEYELSLTPYEAGTIWLCSSGNTSKKFDLKNRICEIGLGEIIHTKGRFNSLITDELSQGIAEAKSEVINTILEAFTFIDDTVFQGPE